MSHSGTGGVAICDTTDVPWLLVHGIGGDTVEVTGVESAPVCSGGVPLATPARQRIGDITPYGGIGYGLYFMRSKVKAFGRKNTENQTRAGLQLHGGAGYRLGPGDVFLEIRYHYTNFRFFATGKSNAGGVNLGLGYRLVL